MEEISKVIRAVMGMLLLNLQSDILAPMVKMRMID
jgi:hypothetical protein